MTKRFTLLRASIVALSLSVTFSFALMLIKITLVVVETVMKRMA